MAIAFFRVHGLIEAYTTEYTVGCSAHRGVSLMLTLEELLRLMVERGGSDLHLAAGSAPRIRQDGRLVELSQVDVLSPEATQKLIYSVLDGEQIARLEQELELDMSFGVTGVGRFRVNVFYQRGAIGVVLRTIPYEMKTFDELGLPKQVCENLCRLKRVWCWLLVRPGVVSLQRWLP